VAVLAAAPDRHAGVASGINNAVARAGTLLAVAALPAIVGLAGAEYRDPTALTAGYHSALLLASGMLALGGVISWFGLHEVGRLTETRRTPAKERGKS
jgi:nitrate/nitrite transporter NarK